LTIPVKSHIVRDNIVYEVLLSARLLIPVINNCLRSIHSNQRISNEKYYSYIKKYERGEGAAFMKLFNPSINQCQDDFISREHAESTSILPQMKKGN